MILLTFEKNLKKITICRFNKFYSNKNLYNHVICDYRGFLGKDEITETGIMIPEFAIKNRKEFVDEVFNSIKKLGRPVKKMSQVTYGIQDIKS